MPQIFEYGKTEDVFWTKICFGHFGNVRKCLTDINDYTVILHSYSKFDAADYLLGIAVIIPNKAPINGLNLAGKDKTNLPIESLHLRSCYMSS